MSEKGFNLQILEFDQALAKLVNETKLPVRVKRTSLQNILTQVVNIENQTIIIERKSYEDSLKKEGAEDAKEIHEN